MASSVLIKLLQQPLSGNANFSSAAGDPLRLQVSKLNQQEFYLQVSKHCKQGRLKDAIDALYAKDPSAEQATSETYICLLECCSRVRSLKEAKRIHAHIMKSGMYGKMSNRLITMYAKCRSLQDAVLVFDSQSQRNAAAWNAVLLAHAELGSLQQARRVFDLIPNPNITTWNAMITACAKHGCSKKALQVFEKMFFEEQYPPNKSTFTSLLNSFIKPEALEDGKAVYALVVKAGLESAETAWAVINMYAKCGKVDDAQYVFEATPSRNVLCWAGMITACANNGRNEAAFQYFQQMLQEGLVPTLAIFIKFLEVCASMGFLTEGKIIQSQLAENNHESVVPVANALILMYSKCKCLEEAKKVFDKMAERDVFTWTLMIKANVEGGITEEARRLFQEMQQKGVKPNAFTFSIILDTFSSQLDLEAGVLIHSQVSDYGFESNIVVKTALINMYAKCGSLSKARMLFDKLDKKDKVLWTTMIGMYVRYGNKEEALDLFEKMEEDGVKPDKLTYINALSACACPAMLAKGQLIHTCVREGGFESDIVVKTALMNMYARCGCLDLARKIFNEMHDRDVVMWTALLAAYAQLDDNKVVLQLFKEMRKEGVQPNKVTYVTILGACCNASDLDLGKMIHEDILDSGHECDAKLGAALINMYTKCGSVHDVQRTFDKISDRDVDVWNLVLAAHVQHDLSKEAIQLFEQMCQQPQSVQPDKVTFIHVLSACRKAGLVDEGRRFFDSMRSDHGIVPAGEHFACMVDLLGNVGLLKEAESYLCEMPSQPSAFVWMTMLHACKLYGDVERGERAARRVLDVDEYNVEAYGMLASLYAAAGMQGNEAYIRKEMDTKKGAT